MSNTTRVSFAVVTLAVLLASACGKEGSPPVKGPACVSCANGPGRTARVWVERAVSGGNSLRR